MRFSAVFATLAVLLAAPLALAAPPSLLSVERATGPTTGKYIVKFKAGVSRKRWIGQLKLKDAVDWDLVNGFASQSFPYLTV